MSFNKFERYNNFKWELLKGASFEGMYDMPLLKPISEIPHDLTGFHMIKSVENPESRWFHFYEDDYQFERIWNRPGTYLPLLRGFAGGISPDFSIYLDMPRAQQIWNCWRNRVMAYWMQSNGIAIVPNVGWSDECSLAWAFDGIPEGSVLSITTQGCLRDGVCKQSLVNGIHELALIKRPTALFVYGKFPETWKDQFPMPIITYPSFSTEKWSA